jgi:acetyl-CoA carboxylase / biotin carboxylase 1
VAVHFADLHDTPGRMKAKGVIRKQVQWQKSRTYFFWRLRRRLTEFDVARRTPSEVSPSEHRKTIMGELYKWYIEQGGSPEAYDDDRKMMLWLSEKNNEFVKFIDNKKHSSAASQISKIVSESDDQSLKDLLSKMDKKDLAKLAKAMQP